MIRRLSFGQYVHKNSVIHSLDPRLKVVYVLILSILVFMVENIYEILIFAIFVFIAVLLAKINFKNYIKNLSPFYFLFIFILLMYVIFSRNNLNQGLLAIWRFLMLISISIILTFSTTLSSLIVAIEKLSRPLKLLGIKPRNIALTISIAIRFVPVMFIQMERTKESMLARLANFRKLKHIRLFMIVLLEKMFKSASRLSDALQSRLYNENVESQKVLKLKSYDYLSMLLVIFFVMTIY